MVWSEGETDTEDEGFDAQALDEDELGDQEDKINENESNLKSLQRDDEQQTAESFEFQDTLKSFISST